MLVFLFGRVNPARLICGFQVLRTCGLLHDPIPPVLGYANSSLGDVAALEMGGEIGSHTLRHLKWA